MYYHGAESHYVVAMKWTTSILFLVSSFPFFTIPGALAARNVVTFLAPPEVKTARGGANVVYACSVGGESGPCVDEPILCTSQGGKFVGYCFFQGHYEGVCCTGLNPANSTLTTTKAPKPHDDSTSAPPPFTTQTFPPATLTSQTFPPAPTMTTQTLPPPPSLTSDTLPPASMTTQTLPPAPTLTSDTLPPAPTFTTQTLPPATMTTQSLPPSSSFSTQTLPPAPTMTSDTFPPAPTMTTLTMPPSSTFPPAPTMTTETLPPAPTLSTQTLPPAPTMTSDTLPPAPTMTTESLPPAPTLTTQTFPPAPTWPTQTPPPAPSPPEGVVNDETTTSAPTPPSMPTMSTQTLPPAPTQPTQTLPPAPTQPTQTFPPAPTQPTLPTETLPPAPTQPTQTLPPAPTQPTQTLPPAPTQPTQTLPPAPTQPTQTLPPAPTQPTLPPAPTQPTETLPPAPTQPTLPPAPTQPTETLPPAPTQPTQTLPPAPTQPTETLPPTPTQPTLPPAPTQPTETLPPTPTQPTLPPAPTQPTETLPPTPTQPTLPPAPTQPTETVPPTPTQPTLPAMPTQPTETLPPAPTQPTMNPPSQPTPPPAHFDNSSSTHHTLFPTMFPTMSTQTMSTMTMSTNTFPDFNLTMTTQSMNFTTNSWNFTTHSFNFTTHQMNMTTQIFPNFTMTTEGMNFTTQQFNITMTTLQMPNITGPHFPTTSTTTEATTVSEGDNSESTAATVEDTTTATSPPSFDVPGSGGCGIVSNEILTTFQNPSYPSLDTEPSVYEYSVTPHEGYCALRIEFIESHLAGKGMEGCATDSVVIINSVDAPTIPQCGLLEGYQFTVRQEQGQPVKIVVTAQSAAHLWNINVTQIHCSSIRPYQEYESPNCGVKNPKEAPPGVSIHNEKEEPKSISPTKLLKSRKKTLKDIMTDPSLAPSKLLQSAVLNRETNIKIVRGNETAINEYPWQALLMVSGRPLCGASIINDQWVVTAGHCVQLSLRYPLSSVLTVDLGDHDLRTTKETRNIVFRVSRVVPNVQNEGVMNDIALIKLASKIPIGKTIRPVCLPPTKTPVDTYAGRTGTTTGWGRTEDSVISPVLREATLPILSNEKCRQQWATVGEGAGSIIDNGMICAGGGDVGPCNGDSGGPLVVEDDDKYRLVGLTSFGLLRGCAVSGVPSVFARVTSYLNWIALNLAEV